MFRLTIQMFLYLHLIKHNVSSNLTSVTAMVSSSSKKLWNLHFLSAGWTWHCCSFVYVQQSSRQSVAWWYCISSMHYHICNGVSVWPDSLTYLKNLVYRYLFGIARSSSDQHYRKFTIKRRPFFFFLINTVAGPKNYFGWYWPPECSEWRYSSGAARIKPASLSTVRGTLHCRTSH